VRFLVRTHGISEATDNVTDSLTKMSPAQTSVYKSVCARPRDLSCSADREASSTTAAYPLRLGSRGLVRHRVSAAVLRVSGLAWPYPEAGRHQPAIRWIVA
jgi:hypothetical protein